MPIYVLIKSPRKLLNNIVYNFEYFCRIKGLFIVSQLKIGS